mgnify:FL=1
MLEIRLQSDFSKKQNLKMAVVKRRYQQPQVDTSFNMTEMFESIVETEEKKKCVFIPFNAEPHEYNPMMTRQEYMSMYFDHQNQECYYGSEDEEKPEKFETEENQPKIDEYFEKRDYNPNSEGEEEPDAYWEEQDYEDWRIYIKPSSDVTEKYEENEERWEEEYERQRFFDYDSTYVENEEKEEKENTTMQSDD